MRYYKCLNNNYDDFKLGEIYEGTPDKDFYNYISFGKISLLKTYFEDVTLEVMREKKLKKILNEI